MTTHQAINNFLQQLIEKILDDIVRVEQIIRKQGF